MNNNLRTLIDKFLDAERDYLRYFDVERIDSLLYDKLDFRIDSCLFWELYK